MSNRSLLEFNHDYCPRNYADCLRLGRALQSYMCGADPGWLPDGVIRKHYRHHSDPDPMRVQASLVAALRKLIADLDGLIGESRGVYGLHLNGDPTPWSELLEGGRFGEWLCSLEAARAALHEAGEAQ